MIAVLAVAIGQGQSLPGGEGRPRLTRHPAARTSFAQQMRHPAGGRHSQRGVWVGGGPGVRYTSPFCPGGGAQTSPRRPVPERSSSTCPGRTTITSSHLA
jgi:hypothetical protein